MIKDRIFMGIAFLSIFILFLSCSKKISGNAQSNTHVLNKNNDVDFWLTKRDQSVLLQKQSVKLSFGSITNSNPTIKIDIAQTFQTIDGFGYSLTGGSASVINKLPQTAKAQLLKESYLETITIQ